jgi:hypothetical protein
MALLNLDTCEPQNRNLTSPPLTRFSDSDSRKFDAKQAEMFRKNLQQKQDTRLRKGV